MPEMVRTRLWGALLLTLSLIPALACYLVFTLWLPGDIDRYRDYTRAEPCAAGTSPREHEDCLREVAFTVDGTRIKGGRSAVYEATLSGAPSWNGVLEFGDSGPLLSELERGDRVTGTVWRGDIMALSRDGVRQKSSDEPRDEPQMAAALGTCAGLLSALALAVGAARLTRPRPPHPFPWRGWGKPLLIVLSVGCPVLGLVAVWWGIPWWLLPTVLVPLMGYTAWELHRYPGRRPGPAADSGGATGSGSAT
ncbi:hypothetical protein [Streptomyces griseoruber]|uniref:hypothetical protein n=1 Tax=Streptomyces griseoruber TaxID=1943 RepID=UPI000A6473BD|nr:hypothetical protein [Streptomyces griseoruber]